VVSTFWVTPVASLDVVTVAPGTIAPLWSETVPSSVLEYCAQTLGPARARTTSKPLVIRSLRRIGIEWPPYQRPTQA
jgi:hypothetical protein